MVDNCICLHSAPTPASSTPRPRLYSALVGISLRSLHHLQTLVHAPCSSSFLLSIFYILDRSDPTVFFGPSAFYFSESFRASGTWAEPTAKVSRPRLTSLESRLLVPGFRSCSPVQISQQPGSVCMESYTFSPSPGLFNV